MKNILIIVMCLLFLSAHAQETTKPEGPVSKSGVPVLPVAGDFAIGIDALPFLEFLGNSFNNNAANTLDLKSTNLYLRYHLSDNSAVRLIVSIKNKETINRNYVQDDAALFLNPLSNAKVEDKQKIVDQGYGFNLAFQKSRGYGRLRGLYGVQVNYGFIRTTNTFEYGNTMNLENTTPSTTAWFSAASPRTLETDGGINQMAGAGLLGGVEYYFLPKACIGFEIGLNYNINWKSQSNSKIEMYESGAIVQKDIVVAPKGRTEQGINSNRYANYPYFGGKAGLYLMFHF